MVQKRNTWQKEIIQKKMNEIESFFNADELWEDVKKENKNIGIATIYRFLNEMRRNNLIYSYKCDRKTVFSKQNKSHCHFVCEKTGNITHFKIESLDFLKDKIPGSIRSFQVEVRGICKEECKKCSKKHG